MASELIEVDVARHIVLDHVRALPTETVPLNQALFRTLAEAIRSDTDQPAFDRSVMDGYAVRAEDVSKPPTTLVVVGEVSAGHVVSRTLCRGEAMRINTGGRLPSGADAVIRVEDTESSPRDGSVLIRAGVERGQFITKQGAYALSGKTVLEPGTILGPLEIGVAACTGAVNITVYCRPKIAIVSTGDELVDACDTPGDGRIRNSNEHVLESLIRTAHATPVVLGIARDDRRSLMDKLSVGLQSDVLCITGGVSMGTLDLVPGVLAELGVSIHVRRISIKPGRPTVFGTHPGGALVFALPGNPVSAFIAFELLVRPALAVMQGRSDECARPFAALLEGTMESTSHRRSYWPARAFVRNDGRWEAVKLPWQGSGDSFGMAKANALIVRPANSPAVSDGQEVSIHLLDRW